MMERRVLIWALALLPAALSAQHTQWQTGWLASFNTYQLSDHLSIHLDAQLRGTDNAEQLQTFLFRPGLNWHINKRQIVTAGYAWIPNRYNKVEDNELLPEHRLWQQFIIWQPLARTSVQHRFRFEERWVPVPDLRGGDDLFVGDVKFSTRFRYFNRAVVPFRKPAGAFSEGAFWALQNEVFLHTTNRNHTNGKWFDQNRLYGALGWRLHKGFDIEAGYMWQFVDRAGTTPDLSNHILQLAVYWRKS